MYKFGLICQESPEQWEMATIQELLTTGLTELRVLIQVEKSSKRRQSRDSLATTLLKEGQRSSEHRALLISIRESEKEGILQWANQVRTLALDFVLDLVGVPIEKVWAELEIWRFDHLRPLAFWETLANRSTIVVQLRSYRGGRSFLLRSGQFKTVAGSYLQVTSYIRRQICKWPAYAAASGGIEARHHTDAELSIPISRTTKPRVIDHCRLFVQSLRNSVTTRLTRYFRHELWAIGIVTTNSDGFPALTKVNWLSGPKGQFRADPFGLESEDGFFILCEQFDYRKDKGVIVASALDSSGRILREEVVLEEQTHMSYPFLLRYGRDIYCIPETHQRNCVTLYRAVEFPWKWERVSDLLRGFAAVDSTLCHWNGMWWLFCSSHEEGPNDKLFLFYSPDLLHGWRPHRMNPVKIDVTSSRPAGTPFISEGRLYRPAQDCSETYGGRVVVNRVLKLSDLSFAEEAAWYAEPNVLSPFREGLHTLSKVNGKYLIDGKRHTFLLSGFQRAIGQHYSKWIIRLKMLA
jgi:hypothetical protein